MMISARDIKRIRDYYASLNHRPEVLDELLRVMEPQRFYAKGEFCVLLGNEARRLLASYFDLAVAMVQKKKG